MYLGLERLMHETLTKDEMVIFEGSALSDGITIAPLYFLNQHSYDIPSFSIEVNQIQGEIERYRKALNSSRHDLKKIQAHLVDEGSKEGGEIIDAHIQMLDDPMITVDVEERIQKMMRNTETVFRTSMKEYEEHFSAIDDHEIKQRLLDVKDLSQRILKHLHPEPSEEIKVDKQPSILCDFEIKPSLVAEMGADEECGFIATMGGYSSHTALIARSRGIPLVAGVDLLSIRRLDVKCAVVDGFEGKVIINPTEEVLKSYREKKKLLKQEEAIVEELKYKSETADQHSVEVFANIETSADIKRLLGSDVKKIGLVRSEFLVGEEQISSCDEEAQVEIYREFFYQAQDYEVDFRLFDLGAEKECKGRSSHELNPALGCRAIRFLLKHNDILKTQLRALFRSSLKKKLRLLLPLVTDVLEIREIREVITEVHKELEVEDLDYNDQYTLGAMIETPSSIFMIEHIAKEVSFLSVGTNDLIQFVFAKDRSCPHLTRGCDEYHPAIFKMIQEIVKRADKCGIPTSICGDMASKRLLIPVLIGLGIRNLSTTPRNIPIVNKIISDTNYSEAIRVTKEILTQESSLQVKRLLGLK